MPSYPSWITKERKSSSSSASLRWDKTYLGKTETRYLTQSYKSGAESISYQGGPRYHGWSGTAWKRCIHHKTKVISGSIGYVTGTFKPKDGDPDSHGEFQGRVPAAPMSGSASHPTMSEPPNQDLWDAIHGQLDLNFSESSLVYSNVIQMVPLLGGLAKANTVLRRISNWASRSLKRQPFTTVIKAAISADFIDRFVINPTLNDLRMAQNATDDVLKRLNTLNKRKHARWITLKAHQTQYDSRSERDGSAIRIEYPWNYAYGRFTIGTRIREESGVRHDLFVRAAVEYPDAVVNPIRMYAQRVGLTRPLDSVWDLVPFSFVCDYFFRTGDLISSWSDAMSSQDGLKGKIAEVGGVWLCSKAFTRAVRQGTSVIAQYASPTNLQWKHIAFTGGSLVTETCEFLRMPYTGQNLSQSGFWDDGLVSPHLTITRARTLAELWLQAKL